MLPQMKIFEGRTCVIATMHGKESVIAPILENQLKVKTDIPKGFNSDQFGTFSGEVERKVSPYHSAKLKCCSAMEIAGDTLGIASEGSFGPHPQFFFAPCDEELILLMDLKNGLEVVHREISVHTNFMASEVKSLEELKDFALRALFPSHGLILRTDNELKKGIVDWEVLEKNWRRLKNYGQSVFVETDMRAMFNPTRMEVIELAVRNLAKKIHSTCPQCDMPGFYVKDYQSGLPCRSCGFPTRSPLAEISICDKCNFQIENQYPNGIKFEDPKYCDFCNP